MKKLFTTLFLVALLAPAANLFANPNDPATPPPPPCAIAQKGEGFSQVAKRCDLKTAALIKANRAQKWWRHRDFVPLDAELTVPAADTTTAAAPATGTAPDATATQKENQELRTQLADAQKKAESSNTVVLKLQKDFEDAQAANAALKAKLDEQKDSDANAKKIDTQALQIQSLVDANAKMKDDLTAAQANQRTEADNNTAAKIKQLETRNAELTFNMGGLLLFNFLLAILMVTFGVLWRMSVAKNKKTTTTDPLSVTQVPAANAPAPATSRRAPATAAPPTS